MVLEERDLGLRMYKFRYEPVYAFFAFCNQDE